MNKEKYPPLTEQQLHNFSGQNPNYFDDATIRYYTEEYYKSLLPKNHLDQYAKPSFRKKPIPKPDLNKKVAPIGGRKTRRRRRHKKTQKSKKSKKNKKRSHRRKTKRKY